MADKLIVIRLEATNLEAKDDEATVGFEVAAGPQGRCRVKHWDKYGRDADWAGVGGCDFDGTLETRVGWWLGPVRDLKGRTLTWSVRLAARDPSIPESYSFRLRVLRGRETVPGGEFIYSGPLDDVEEFGDVVHFDVI